LWLSLSQPFHSHLNLGSLHVIFYSGRNPKRKPLKRTFFCGAVYYVVHGGISKKEILNCDRSKRIERNILLVLFITLHKVLSVNEILNVTTWYLYESYETVLFLIYLSLYTVALKNKKVDFPFGK